MINLNLSTYNLLTNIPDSFTVSGVTDTADITVILNDVDIFGTTLFAYNGVVTFYSLRDLVMQHMRANTLPFVKLRIKAEHPSAEYSNEVYIVYCDYGKENITDADFLSGSFLTIRTYMRIPSEATGQISFFATGAETAYADCILMVNGHSIMQKVPLTVPSSTYPAVITLDVSPETIKQKVFAMGVITTAQLKSYSVYVGERAITYYVNEQQPEITMTFRNAFNVEEYIYIYGATTEITEVDRQEAICQGRTQFYNQKVKHRYNVVTETLGIAEAKWYNELFASDFVFTKVDGATKRILITDITSEIKDATNETTKMRFTWFFDNDWAYISHNPTIGIFTNPYNRVYE